MDVESLDTLKAAVDHLNATTIPALEQAMMRVSANAANELSALADRTTTELGNVGKGLTDSLQAMLDRLMTRIDALESRIDGATVKLGPAKEAAPNAAI